MPKLKQALLTNRLSPNHSWRIVRLLVRLDDQDANYWLDKLSQEDKSASPPLNRYVAEAQKNDLAVKECWIKEAKNLKDNTVITR